MPAAIRIDGTEVIHGKRHIDLLLDWLAREGLTEDQGDAVLEAGRVEFGAVFYNFETKQFDKWSGDDTRDSVYRSVGKMVAINGRPQTREGD